VPVRSGTGPCVARQLAGGPVVVPEGVILRADGPGVQVSLRRYASDSFPLALGALPPGQPEELRVSSDRSQRPWTIQLSGSGAVDVCDQSSR